ncbi:ScbR family autoregulator-binding transcription factor [Streptomyces yaanensis]|uniref:ScbR family autoregulator-binding transcription factor n=1 Tax=Streptomyces yaanensis TaxID=1142239 RepID=A0ABV7S7V7_9ACTN|nr:ScbR family autoregulator-binding transcription factor [Streptomyces sp. CGMCC 4.7035]WNC02432.1 ScbR family autoregulator-binding transcription factor [Streptomyces sp. CGMCC 4.7035]
MAKQERAVRTRKALIESAAELFSRDGFELVSLSAISSRAGVSNGALHFHFPSKAALAAAVRDAAAQRFGRIVSAERPPPQLGGSLQALVDTSHALLRGLGHDVILRAGFDLADGAGGAGRGEDLYQRWHAWVEVAVARSAREGLLSDVAPRDLVATVVGATVGFAALGGHDVRWLSSSTLTRFWSLLLPRIASAPALRGLVAGGRRAEAS